MKITKRNERNDQKLAVSEKDPMRAFQSIHDSMDRIFSDHFMLPFRRLGLDYADGLSSFTPRVDISETDSEVKVRAEVPGIDPKDVHVEVTEDTLSISGNVEKTMEEKQENFYRMERNAGRFSREFALPSKIDADSVSAEAKNGIISISLKKQPSEHKKRVDIKT